jgi:hypothetical protein
MYLIAQTLTFNPLCRQWISLLSADRNVSKHSSLDQTEFASQIKKPPLTDDSSHTFPKFACLFLN